MPENELWLTKILNDLFGNAAASLLAMLHIHMDVPGRPITNYVSYELLVTMIIVVVALVLRASLSVDKPGALQHCFEIFYDFVKTSAVEQVGPHGVAFVPVVMTMGVFILFSNLIGLIPTFEAPTQNIQVTLGCAIVAFCYYNLQGIKYMGLWKYLLHFTGPVWWLAWLMLPIELFSHMARNMSLSVRLYANMFAGEEVLKVFLHLAPIGVPVIFLGLHVFVAFLQTYIFMLMTLIYLAGAAHHEEHHEDAHHETARQEVAHA